MTIKRLLVAGSLLGAFLLPAHAQFLQSTPPSVVAAFTANGSFQVALASANGNRFGCLIQNQGTHTMYVFVGAGSATTGTSIQLPPPGTNTPSVFSCSLPGGAAIQDEIQVEGTSADAYLVVSQ